MAQIWAFFVTLFFIGTVNGASLSDIDGASFSDIDVNEEEAKLILQNVKFGKFGGQGDSEHHMAPIAKFIITTDAPPRDPRIPGPPTGGTLISSTDTTPEPTPSRPTIPSLSPTPTPTSSTTTAFTTSSTTTPTAAPTSTSQASTSSSPITTSWKTPNTYPITTYEDKKEPDGGKLLLMMIMKSEEVEYLEGYDDKDDRKYDASTTTVIP
ncbi:mucin-7-like [Argopecten irradians]|uniref:mucin-7-like n=1 Tax=Argopecten irradians TaxID=31199 RepID=UPI003710DD15